MNSNEFIEVAEKYQDQFKKLFFKMLRINASLFTSMVSYGIALYIYLWVYDVYGWERTLICIGVGFIVFNLRSKVQNVR